MSFNIRKMKSEDLQKFWTALNSVAQEGKYLLDTQAPAENKMAVFLQAVVENNYPAVFAEEAGDIIGWADMIPQQKPSMKHSASLGMGVVKAHRGKGLGEALLTQVMEMAEREGVTRMELEVFATNLPAIALYRKHNFNLEGTKVNAVFIDGTFVDMHVMARLTD